MLSGHLRRHIGVTLGVRQCQQLFREQGFQLRKPRSQVAQSDPLKVAAVKELRRLAHHPDMELWSLIEFHFPATRLPPAHVGSAPKSRSRSSSIHRLRWPAFGLSVGTLDSSYLRTYDVAAPIKIAAARERLTICLSSCVSPSE